MEKGWQDSATTDPLTIQQWFAEKPFINYGIRTGLVNNIVVIDLDGPEARKWWEETGIGDSSAVVYSPRKDGGQHHYFRVYDVEVQTNKGAAICAKNPSWHKDVDVRGEGGLVIGPGSRTRHGAYVGDLSNIPDAPQTLLDLLPERQSYQRVVDEAEIAALEATEKVSEPSDSELEDIARIEAWLLALPRKWSPGDGWHDTVFRSCCWLWRMVRTPSYALAEDKALEIMLTNTPVWPEWDEQEILKQWDSARSSTRGQFADPPAEELPAPLDFIDTVNRLPEFAPRSQRLFLDVLGDSSVRLRNLIEECLLAGLTPHQTVSVIHGSSAGEKFRATPYGLRKLWREVGSVAPGVQPEARGEMVDGDTEDVPEPQLAITRPQELPDRPEAAVLMSDAERASIVDFHWWGKDYLEWTREITPVWNGPYHRMNRWTILSLILSPVGVLPLSTGDMYCNLFSFTLGETTTGKSESLKIMNSVLRTYFSEEDDPDVGGDPSPSALGAALIERDGKPSLFNADEAHGQIAKMKQDKGYQTGLMQDLTRLYDGEVPKMLRATNKEISGKRATSYFCIHYMGTYEGITDVLEPEDWGSGFLHRFVWAVGETHERTRESMKPKMRKPGIGRERDPRLMQKQWAAHFRSITNRLAPAGEPVELEVDDAALERFTTLRERMYEIADERPNMKERLHPAVRRMSDSIFKASALVAMSCGETKVSMKHLLVAIEQGEEWFGNLLHMVTATDSSKHTRKVAALEKAVVAAGGEMRMEDVYRLLLGGSKNGTDILVTQLVAEGRAEKTMLANGKQVLKTIGRV